MTKPLLSVTGLTTEFQTDEGLVRAVDGVSFDLPPGGTLGIVGESGCGKSVTALSIMGLLPRPNGNIRSGKINYQGEDLAAADNTRLQRIRGNEISMVFQEPMTALNPVHTIGRQLTEVVAIHTDQSPAEQIRTAVLMLQRVGIPAPELRMTEYPHQLSGGMRQRVVIAIALICEPLLLIADEPTTALDVTIQAQILDLISSLQKDFGMAMIMITHDLGVIAETCEQVVVMYAGQVVEQGSVFDIFDRPKHPYTQGLLRSIPKLTDIPKQPLDIIP
ncbi:MAG: ABC transporter ATP-binding protein, partial [Gammaproteobacteria bacterium]|nr:ABC transporter ATP-binding protein [Gammaproteobacteria bacterium]